MGTQFLQSLTGSQGKATLNHFKALGGSIFKRAVIERRIKSVRGTTLRCRMTP
jgi:hypothetical protein